MLCPHCSGYITAEDIVCPECGAPVDAAQEEISGVQTFITCTDASDLEGSLEKRSYQVRMTESFVADIRGISEGETVTEAAEDEDPDFT